jgi:hypothetical protein
MTLAILGPRPSLSLPSGGGLAAVSGLRDGNSRQVPSIPFKA